MLDNNQQLFGWNVVSNDNITKTVINSSTKLMLAH